MATNQQEKVEYLKETLKIALLLHKLKKLRDDKKKDSQQVWDKLLRKN